MPPLRNPNVRRISFADLGVAGGIGEGLLIKHGEIVKKLPEDQLLPALKEELDHWS